MRRGLHLHFNFGRMKGKGHKLVQLGWLLASGSWNDTGVWDDASVWKDAV
jgi:hypothetical protein